MHGAVKNYLHLRKITHPNECHLDVWNFPSTFVEYLNHALKENEKEIDKEIDKEFDDISDWIDVIPFEKNLCHRCNKVEPEATFCPESEGTIFRQRYGWYLDMKHYEYGVVPRLQRFIPEVKSKTLRKLLEYSYNSLSEDLLYDPAMDGLPKSQIDLWLNYHDEIWSLGEPRVWDPQFPYNFTQSLQRELQRRRTAIRRYIEDAIRADFEFQALVGKWKSEQQLYEFVKKLLPKAKIKRNFRPRVLEHLEMDIYLPELGIGIEYQGIQHYEPVAHWGGNKGLAKVQARDERKLLLCEENDIRLLYFHHYEVLTLELVYKRLKPYIPTIKYKPKHNKNE